jgi:hypothetical protein
MSFETLSDQSPWASFLTPGTSLGWSHTSADLGGKIEFVTTVDFTGQISRGAEEGALLRLACIYLIGHLSGKALVDAYHTLTDQYTWQIDRLNAAPTISNEQRIAVANVRETQRVPFIFNEE